MYTYTMMNHEARNNDLIITEMDIGMIRVNCGSIETRHDGIGITEAE